MDTGRSTPLAPPRGTGLREAVTARMVRWTQGPSVGSIGTVSSVAGGGFSVEVERTLPIARVRLRGRLDANAAPRLRTALLTALARQPSGVLVEASEMVIDDATSLAVLASVAYESERWPGTPFAVVGTAQTLAAVERLNLPRMVLACRDTAAAVLALRRQPQSPSRRQRIEPDRNAPATARLAVRQFCQEHHVGGDGDAAQLVVSELVTNAVLHARSPMELTLRLVLPLLHIAVADDSPQPPRISSLVDDSAESGRGLLLVDAVATSWGSLVPDRGKVVWATVLVQRLTTAQQYPA